MPEKHIAYFFSLHLPKPLQSKMKNALALLFALATLTTYAQKEADVLKEANRLIADKQYESAFKTLETFDKDNTKPAVALLKAEIVEEYFVTSLSHQMFALKDLAPGEDIMDYRGTQGEFNMHSFAVNEVLDALIAKNPKNCALYAGLGHFYYEAYTHYPNGWLKSEEELFGLIQANYKKAIEGRCADYKAYETLGFVALSTEKYAEAIAFYLEAIKLNKEYATSYYNIAYAYLYTDDRANAIKYGQDAYNLYKDADYKADAARMVGIAYDELADSPNAIKWLEQANVTQPGSFYTLRPLLQLYVNTGNPKTEATLNEFYRISPLNNDTYSALENIYEGDKRPQLVAFYNRQLEAYKTDDETCGTLHFYIATLFVDNDKPTAHSHLLQAKEHFSKVEGVDSGVFDVINDGLEYTRQ
jgi:tetratricopeptide (TPR) repeat protein